MNLSTKFLVLSAVLIAALAGTQWVLLNLLTAELREKTQEAAFEVSAATVAFLAETTDSDLPASEGRSFKISRDALSSKTPAEDELTAAPGDGKAIMLSSSPGEDGEINVRMILEQLDQGTAPASFPAFKLQPAMPAGPEHRIPIPQEGFDKAFEDYAFSLAVSSGILLLVALSAIWLITFRLTSPLQELSEAARRLGQGELGVQVAEHGGKELATTARAFNTMSTELQSLEEETHRSRERRHLSEIGEIARALAHTMRNPLNTLGLSLERLESRLEDEGERREVFELAQGQIGRLEDALRVFFALAAGDRGTVESIRVENLARDVALEVVQGTPEGISVEVKGTPGELSVMGIAPELRAVLQALIVNAAEASSAAGVVKVNLSARAGGGVVIEVNDRGTGLDASVKERLFTPHVTSKSHGAGMGLFLARRIAEGRYHGSLDLLEREGGGVRARLELGDREAEQGA